MYLLSMDKSSWATQIFRIIFLIRYLVKLRRAFYFFVRLRFLFSSLQPPSKHYCICVHIIATKTRVAYVFNVKMHLHKIYILVDLSIAFLCLSYRKSQQHDRKYRNSNGRRFIFKYLKSFLKSGVDLLMTLVMFDMGFSML